MPEKKTKKKIVLKGQHCKTSIYYPETSNT